MPSTDISLFSYLEIPDIGIVGTGYLRIPNPRQYDLVPSFLTRYFMENDTESSEVYQASVIHQLHCMARIFPARLRRFKY